MHTVIEKVKNIVRVESNSTKIVFPVDFSAFHVYWIVYFWHFCAMDYNDFGICTKPDD